MGKYKRRIYCQFCDYWTKEPDAMVSHIEKKHPEMIPEGFSPWRFFYYLKTGKNVGSCVICHKPTNWNEKTHKYNRFDKLMKIDHGTVSSEHAIIEYDLEDC